MDQQFRPTKRKSTNLSQSKSKAKPLQASTELKPAKVELQPEPFCESSTLPIEPEANRKPPTSNRSNSKLSKVVEMLRAPEGVSIADIMKATDWQAHSVRGAIAGAIKKKLGLSVISERRGDERFYRIAG
jgi:hypothetical protein